MDPGPGDGDVNLRDLESASFRLTRAATDPCTLGKSTPLGGTSEDGGLCEDVARVW
jgi:hypothetical protein